MKILSYRFYNKFWKMGLIDLMWSQINNLHKTNIYNKTSW